MKIIIPRRLPSINHVYFQKGFRKFIKPEGKELRNFIIELIRNDYLKNKQEIESFCVPLDVKLEVYENWLTKKGEVKRVDLDNRAKFGLDSVFEGLQLDDKYIYKLTLLKVQSKTEKSIVYIEKLKGDTNGI